MQSQRPLSQKLPAGLAGVLNPEDNRDSAYFSSTDASSKHTSAASEFGLNMLGSNGSVMDKTPSPTATNPLPHSLVFPLSTSSMSVASMVSPTTPSSGELRRFDRPPTHESTPNSATFAVNGSDNPDALSRRESVDSRFNQGFHDMRLGNSPYASHNQSSVSIHSALQHPRNSHPGVDSLSTHRISNGYQPSADRNPDSNAKTMKVAPAITGPAQSTIARAAEPTKGQAWAFPVEEIQRVPSQSLIESRRSSMADSPASSQFTSESRLPPGQRRLEDGPGSNDYQRLSSASAEYPAVHHHCLKSKQLLEINHEEVGGPAGTQPYSRTPELRVSHKLAERKRRTEMKELFEQLRDLMPQERGSKASKWEILTKAIAEHHRQAEQIKNMREHLLAQQDEIAMLRQELRVQNNGERTQRSAFQPANVSEPYPSDQYGRTRPELLPPLRSLSGAAPLIAPDSMTGVQYEQSRPSAYRPPEMVRY